MKGTSLRLHHRLAVPGRCTGRSIVTSLLAVPEGSASTYTLLADLNPAPGISTR
jgi:hypothetical protein